MTEEISYLTRLSQGRGINEAVKVIDDRKRLSSALACPSDHSRDEILHEVMTCYSGEAYGDINWSKFTGGWTTPEELTLYGRLRKEYLNLVQLSLDPGFIAHLPEFFYFIKTRGYEPQGKDFLTVRNDLKRYLGYRTVFRGMLLDPQEVEATQEAGIESKFLKNKEKKATPYLLANQLENFEANTLSVCFNKLVDRRFHNEDYQSPLISVSHHEDVAIAVGRHFGRGQSNPEKKFYLFKARVPEIDLIFYSEPHISTPSVLNAIIGQGTRLQISVDGKENSLPWDRFTESFVMYKINPDEIIESFIPPVKKSKWAGKVIEHQRAEVEVK